MSEAIKRSPYVSSFPPTFDPSDWIDTRRFSLASAPDRSVPRQRSGLPLVYVTMGSVFGRMQEAQAVYRLLIDAVSELMVEAVLTVGKAIAPSVLGPLPTNVQVGEWIDQSEVLPSATFVVCHGGSGTAYGALAHGVPLVMLPSFADQHQNSEAVAAASAGIIVAHGRDGDTHDLLAVAQIDAPRDDQVQRSCRADRG